MTYRISLYKDGQPFETVFWPDLIGAKERAAYLILVKRATGAVIVERLSGDTVARYGLTASQLFSEQSDADLEQPLWNLKQR